TCAPIVKNTPLAADWARDISEPLPQILFDRTDRLCPASLRGKRAGAHPGIHRHLDYVSAVIPATGEVEHMRPVEAVEERLELSRVCESDGGSSRRQRVEAGMHPCADDQLGSGDHTANVIEVDRHVQVDAPAVLVVECLRNRHVVVSSEEHTSELQ